MKADIVIHNARIFDGRRLLPGATAVSVADGVITAVGPTTDILGAHPDAARVLDAGGRLLCPAFTDAHVHPVMGGWEMGHCELSGAAGAGECLAQIGGYAALFQLRRNQSRQRIVRHCLEMLGIDPAQLGFVELRRAATKVLQAEPL